MITKINHSVWMLASAMQNLTCIENSSTQKQQWLDGAIQSAEKALEEMRQIKISE